MLKEPKSLVDQIEAEIAEEALAARKIRAKELLQCYNRRTKEAWEELKVAIFKFRKERFYLKRIKERINDPEIDLDSNYEKLTEDQAKDFHNIEAIKEII